MVNEYMPYFSAIIGLLIILLEISFGKFFISIFGDILVLPVLAGFFLLILLLVVREGNAVFFICISVCIYSTTVYLGMALKESTDNYNQIIRNTYKQISNNESSIDITDCDTKEIYEIAIEKGYGIQHKDERIVLIKDK